MRFIDMKGHGDPSVLRLAEGEKPEPGPGALRIRVATAGVNRPDCFQRMGAYPPPPGASPILGLEVSGVVDALGEGVTEFQLGDPVCALVNGGGYAEYAVAPAGQVLPVPEGVSVEDAAGIPEAYFTVWFNLMMLGHMKAGERLLVHGGASGIGSCALQLASALDVEVIATAGSDEKTEFARGLGAHCAINYKTADFVEAARVFAPEGVDLVLDMVGGDYVGRNISLLRRYGRHVSIAFLHGPLVELNMLPVMLNQLTITGSTLRPQKDAVKAQIAEALRRHVWPLFAAQKLHVPVDCRFNLKDAAKAHTRMEEGAHKGKILLDVSPLL